MQFYFQQDNDRNMFRLQSTDTVSPSGTSVGRRQRLGRADAVHARGEHLAAEAWQQEGLGCTSLLPLSARARRFRSAQG